MFPQNITICNVASRQNLWIWIFDGNDLKNLKLRLNNFILLHLLLASVKSAFFHISSGCCYDLFSFLRIITNVQDQLQKIERKKEQEGEERKKLQEEILAMKGELGDLKKQKQKKVRIPPGLLVRYFMIFAGHLEDAAQSIILKTVS